MKARTVNGSAARILALLDRHYPAAACSLAFSTPLELLVATILATFLSVALSSIGLELGVAIGILAGYCNLIPMMSGTVGAVVQVTVMPSKHSALFCPVPVVWPSIHNVILAAVATIVPLKLVHVEPV